jgi:hypothetical protein
MQSFFVKRHTTSIIHEVDSKVLDGVETIGGGVELIRSYFTDLIELVCNGGYDAVPKSVREFCVEIDPNATTFTVDEFGVVFINGTVDPFDFFTITQH